MSKVTLSFDATIDVEDDLLQILRAVEKADSALADRKDIGLARTLLLGASARLDALLVEVQEAK